jgi:hypothetical protein
MLLATAVLMGCNAANFPPQTQSSPSSPVSASKPAHPQITGGWEIVATSKQTTSSNNETRVESWFSEDKNGKLTGSRLLVLGIFYQPDSYDLYEANYQVGGLCGYAVDAGYLFNLTGKVQTENDQRLSRVTLKLTEAPGVQFDFTGKVQSDGSITGAYSGGGTYCPDSGSFVAKPAVSIPVGSYDEDTLGCVTCVTAVISENTASSPPTLSFTATATTYLPPYPTCTTTLDGIVVGNGVKLSGLPPNPLACGGPGEDEFDGFYFQNGTVFGRPVPSALLLFRKGQPRAAGPGFFEPTNPS